MARSDALPDHWYKYEFPLPKVDGASVPSKANYDPENLAWMIEMFAQILGTSHTDLIFRYENNTPDNRTDDILVRHPNDKLYLAEKAVCGPENYDMDHYESKARQSMILKLFEENSPAGIKYFKESGCPSFYSVSFSLLPKAIVDSSGFGGFLGDTADTLNVDKVNESLLAHNGDTSYLGNSGTSDSEFLLFSFNELPEDTPETFTSITARWVDRVIIGTGTAAGATLSIGAATKSDYYDLSTGFAYRQLLWTGRAFTKAEVNSIRFRYHNGANPLSSPRKRLTALEIIAKTQA